MEGQSLTCGSADSVVESRIEWHGVGRLVMSGLVTLHVPCLVDGTGHGHMIKEGNGSATTDQQAVRRFRRWLDWNAGTLGGTLGYGDYIDR